MLVISLSKHNALAVSIKLLGNQYNLQNLYIAYTEGEIIEVMYKRWILCTAWFSHAGSHFEHNSYRSPVFISELLYV